MSRYSGIVRRRVKAFSVTIDAWSEISKSFANAVGMICSVAIAANGNTQFAGTAMTAVCFRSPRGDTDSSELVLLNDKQKETTFKLDSSTKKEGTINKGAHVTVYYKNQNHERIATEIKVEPKKS